MDDNSLNHDDRRRDDVRLALLEQKVDLTLSTLGDRFDKLERKIDAYNGLRERLDQATKLADKACRQNDAHEARHWMYWVATAAPILVGVVVYIIKSLGGSHGQ